MYIAMRLLEGMQQHHYAGVWYGLCTDQLTSKKHQHAVERLLPMLSCFSRIFILAHLGESEQDFMGVQEFPA